MSTQDRPLSITFKMHYQGTEIDVIVHSGGSDWGVLFNGRLVAILDQDDDGDWFEESDELDQVYVDLIANKTERYTC